MRLRLEEEVKDLLTGLPMRADGKPDGAIITVRRLVIMAGINPHPEDQTNMNNAVMAWELANRAANSGGYMTLTVDEASLLKTRAFGVLFIHLAGALNHAIEVGAEELISAPPDKAPSDEF